MKRIWWKLRWRQSKRLWLLTLNNGMHVLVPNSGVGALIYYLGQSEPETATFFEQYLRKGMIVFDVGAHLGEYALRAAQAIGDEGKVYAFEPNPYLGECIQQNVHLNKLQNVELFRVAVADKDTEVSFGIASDSALSALAPATGSTQSVSRKAQTIQVPSKTLDTIWDSLGKPRIDLIKIDVEGAEYLVFKGASNLLNQSPDSAPVLLFEFNQTNYTEFGFTRTDVLSLLSQHGYHFLKLSVVGGIQPVHSELLLGNEETGQNIVATKDIEAFIQHMELGE